MATNYRRGQHQPGDARHPDSRQKVGAPRPRRAGSECSIPGGGGEPRSKRVRGCRADLLVTRCERTPHCRKVRREAGRAAGERRIAVSPAMSRKLRVILPSRRRAEMKRVSRSKLPGKGAGRKVVSLALHDSKRTGGEGNAVPMKRWIPHQCAAQFKIPEAIIELALRIRRMLSAVTIPPACFHFREMARLLLVSGCDLAGIQIPLVVGSAVLLQGSICHCICPAKHHTPRTHGAIAPRFVGGSFPPYPASQAGFRIARWHAAPFGCRGFSIRGGA